MTMRARTAVYEPNGARLGVLPTPLATTATFPLGDTGALTLDYALTAPRAALLGGPRELALEVSHDDGANWDEPWDARYVLLRRSGDDTARPGIVQYEAPAYRFRLTKARVLPEGLLNDDGKRPFLSVTPGAILLTLFQEAQARGALAGMSADFTAEADSDGQPWASILSLYLEPGLDYLTVLLNLEDQGVAESAMRGRTLSLWNAGTVRERRLDAPATGDPVVLRKGRDLTEAPFRGTLDGLADYAYLLGDEGFHLEVTNPEAVTPWGRQEAFITQGGVSDEGTARLLVQAELDRSSRERVERTYGLTFALAAHLPFRDYRPGDYLLVATNGAPEALRLRQITVAADAKGAVSGNVVLNDRFLEAEVRQARRVQGITGGAVTGGTGVRPAPETPSTTTPAAPQALLAQSDAYLDGDGAARGSITATWQPVTTGTDGVALTVVGYELSAQFGADPEGPWSLVTSTPGTTVSVSPFEPGAVLRLRVRAISEAGVPGEWSSIVGLTVEADTTPPPVPSAPVVTAELGALTVTWDGLGDGGAGMPLDFQRVDVAMGADASATEVIGSLRGRGSLNVAGQPYDAPRHFRLRAVDRSGNQSAWSVAASGTPVRLVDLPEWGEAIEGVGGTRVTSSDTAPDVDGVNAGDLWQRYDTLTGAGSLQAAWRWDGTAWQPVTLDETYLPLVNIGDGTYGTLDGGRLTADTVTANAMAANSVEADAIKVGALDGKVITGATIRSAASGARTEMTSQGFRTLAADGSELVKVGHGIATGMSVRDPRSGVLTPLAEAVFHPPLWSGSGSSTTVSGWDAARSWPGAAHTFLSYDLGITLRTQILLATPFLTSLQFQWEPDADVEYRIDLVNQATGVAVTDALPGAPARSGTRRMVKRQGDVYSAMEAMEVIGRFDLVQLTRGQTYYPRLLARWTRSPDMPSEPLTVTIGAMASVQYRP